MKVVFLFCLFFCFCLFPFQARASTVIVKKTGDSVIVAADSKANLLLDNNGKTEIKSKSVCKIKRLGKDSYVCLVGILSVGQSDIKIWNSIQSHFEKNKELAKTASELPAFLVNVYEKDLNALRTTNPRFFNKQIRNRDFLAVVLTGLEPEPVLYVFKLYASNGEDDKIRVITRWAYGEKEQSKGGYFFSIGCRSQIKAVMAEKGLKPAQLWTNGIRDLLQAQIEKTPKDCGPPIRMLFAYKDRIEFTSWSFLGEDGPRKKWLKEEGPWE